MFLAYAAFGFAGGILLIVLAKIVMAGLLQRDNDYYGKKEDRGGEQDG